MLNKICALLPIFGLTVACGGLPSAQEASSSVKITQGTPVADSIRDARYLSTVAITTTQAGASGASALSRGKSFCTGTLITPRIVLTAAHCLTENAQTASLPTESIVVSFGNSVATGKYVRVAAQGFHAGYNPRLTLQAFPASAPNDIALLLLASDAPAPFVPASITSSAVRTGETAWLAGFGLTIGQGLDGEYPNDTGILRQARTALSRIDSNAGRISVGNEEVSSQPGACNGDSGGPLYLIRNDAAGERKLFVRGVLSTGLSQQGRCTGANTYTDIGSYMNWLQSGVRKLEEAQGRGVTTLRL